MKYSIDFIINLEKNMDGYIEQEEKTFNDFLVSYKNLQTTSNIPIFNNSTKFNNKNKKMHKNRNNTQCIFIRNKNAWVPNSSNELDKKIKHSIISNLNKISSQNFDKISDILIQDLRKTENKDIFDVLCDELLNKNIYDKDYQDEYVKLCIKICNESINSDDNIYNFNNKSYLKNDTKYIGPFNTYEEAVMYNNNNLYFKRILLNKLYDKFIHRLNIYDEVINSNDVDIKYKKKREIFSILEFICKLFSKDVIEFDIIYLIHTSLLNINCSVDHININIEILYNMWNILSNISVSSFNLIHVSNIFIILQDRFMYIDTIYRIKFFIECLVDNIRTKFKNKLIESNINDFKILYDKCTYLSDVPIIIDNTVHRDNEIDCCFIEDELTTILTKGDIYSYIYKMSNVEEYLDTLIYIVLNNFIYKDKCIECLDKLKADKIIDNDLLKRLISHSDEEINEMVMDNYKVRNNYLDLKNILYDQLIVESC
jgi:hypothetical protein